MQFSDTTNKNGIIQDIEDACGLGDAGISNQAVLLKQFTAKINKSMSKIWSMIFQSYGGWVYDDSNQTDLPEATTNIVADQQSYGLDGTMLTVLRVEVTDSGGNVRRLLPITQEQIESPGLADFISTTNGNPQYYRLTDGIIQLFPAPVASVTDGLCVYFERDSVQFASTDTTRTPGFASPFHYLVPLGAAIDWLKYKQPNSKTLQELKEDMATGESNLREFYQERWRDKKPRLNTPQHDWN